MKLTSSPALGMRFCSVMASICFLLTKTMMEPEPSVKLKLMPVPVRKGRASVLTTPSTRIWAKFMVGWTSLSLTTGTSRLTAMSHSRKRPMVASRTAAQRVATRLMRFSTLAPQ